MKITFPVSANVLSPRVRNAPLIMPSETEPQKAIDLQNSGRIPSMPGPVHSRERASSEPAKSSRDFYLEKMLQLRHNVLPSAHWCTGTKEKPHTGSAIETSLQKIVGMQVFGFVSLLLLVMVS